METQKVTHTPDVLIIGGGLAGLSAAVELSANGFSIFLVEQKQHLGGRAYSFIHQATGDEVDNGQHLLMGCYHSTLKYLKLIGAYEKISIQKNLCIPFRHSVFGKKYLKAISLPAPLNVLWAMMRLQTISLRNRLALIRVGIKLLFTNPEKDKRLQSLTVEEWLNELQQPDENKQYLWNIIAIGALNDSTDKISATLFVRVLKTVFFGKRIHSSLAFPTAGLSSVFVQNAVELIERNSGRILLNTSIEKIQSDGEKINEIILRSEEKIQPRCVISAVPYFDIQKIFHPAQFPEFNISEKFESSPIVTIHAWFDAQFMDEYFVALLDSPFHWVFNKTKIYKKQHSSLMYLSAVVSGAHELAEEHKDEIAEKFHNEMKKYYPAASAAKIIHSLVIKEKRATFSPTVDVQQYRPKNIISIKNLFLAGDWTDTKLPATIEGAIQSGFTAAELAKNYLMKNQL